MKRMITTALVFFLLRVLVHAANQPPDGWLTVSPRDEIRPEFSFDSRDGPNHASGLVVTHDRRDGLDGWFHKSFAVSGGDYYRFQVVRLDLPTAVVSPNPMLEYSVPSVKLVGMKSWIVADPQHLGGSPRVRDTRISLALILESLAADMSVAQIVDAYPSLTEESVRGTLTELARQKELQPV